MTDLQRDMLEWRLLGALLSGSLLLLPCGLDGGDI
jgi:hypothetical protein